MFNGYYKSKKVLLTGHSGFKGGWLSLWLSSLGAEVHGLSLEPGAPPNLHEIIRDKAFASETFCDIRDAQRVEEAVGRVQPDFVFHLAAQPLVRQSYLEPMQTLQTNVIGTANVLQAIRSAQLPSPVLVVTSDKCYDNKEWEFAYRENDPLGGHDVYSMSKACTELVAQAWRKSFFAPNERLGPLATARAGNVIGGGDYAPDRIVPDCVRAWSSGAKLSVRSPDAVRPWQHVLECLSGYLWLGACMGSDPRNQKLATAFNFGPEPAARQTVRRLVEEMRKTWNGEWLDDSDPCHPHEAKLLTLTIDKAAAVIGWRPCWDFETGVRETAVWYHRRHVKNCGDLLSFSLAQIQTYHQAALAQGVAWAK